MEDNSFKQTQHRIISVQLGHRHVIGLTKPFATARKVQAKLLSKLGEFQRVLFVGSGEGDEAETIFELAKLNLTDFEVFACDISPEKIERFRIHFPQSLAIHDDFSKPGLPAALRDIEPLDLIQMGFIFHDNSEKGKMEILKNSYSLLRHGGHLMIADPLLNTYPNIPRFITNETAKACVKEEFREYFTVYIKEVKEFQLILGYEQDALLESLQGALEDSYLHEDGRESFETRPILEERLRTSGFVDIEFHYAYNKVSVVLCKKPSANSLE